MTENEQLILQHISKAAIYEQLAEECAELAQAALKMARIERGENPTPEKRQTLLLNLTEEASDVVNCLRLSGIEAREEEILFKNHRWVKRLKGEMNHE